MPFLGRFFKVDFFQFDLFDVDFLSVEILKSIFQRSGPDSGVD